MSSPQEWLLRSVPRATFINVQTGKPMFQLYNLKTSGIENSTTTAEARGGDGNALLATWESNRTAKISLQSATFDNRAIAIMTGNNLITGASAIYKREVLTVATNATSLTYTPTSATGALLAVYKQNPDGTEGAELNYTAATLGTGQYTHSTAKAIQFFAGDIPNGSSVIVYYMTNTDATASTITISADKFAGSFKLVLDCVVRSNADKLDYAAQYEFPTVRANSAFSMQMQADGDPAVFDMPIDVLKPANSTTMYTFKVFDPNLLT